MQTVKLTKFECGVILDSLNQFTICEAKCYCDYGEGIDCQTMNDKGENVCELLRAIDSIQEKISQDTSAVVVENTDTNKCGFLCPSCKNVVSEYDDYGFKPKLKKYPYCKFCGQKLSWKNDK